ncbi:heme biosynthesis protein HemY [Rodentibacter rarus]|uniref:heme biosynthesis protein HemY n=1 Tax=Rodentibacter rarus TaxID=1908260 RepID=UPI0009869AC6|nr:heme biosynthesis protein HemY [Rodentibacter rarus]OOF39321.1 heme biosynthesis protein HemY [Rodentibacter rarus]
MFRTLFLMLALLAGLIAGPHLSGQQGYVRIETANNIYEMSITTLVILFVATLAIIYFVEWGISRFLRLSNNTYSWFSRRKRVKAQKQTLKGLMKMNEGDYAKAEKLIGKNAKHSDEPILNLITAAEAAQQRGDEFSANRYLIEATELAGSDNLLVEIARTRILLQQNKLPAARSSVDSLLEMTDRNKEVLKLAVEIYTQSKAYQALDNILDLIQRAGIYNEEEFKAIQVKTENGLLDEKMNEEGVDGLLAWWEEQPRRRRQDLDLKVALIERLIDCNDHESAYEFTLEVLKKWGENTPLSPTLCTQITRLQPVDNTKLIKMIEKRVKRADEDQQCGINRALGYLYVRNNEFTKAAEAFKKVIACPKQLESNDTMMAIYIFEQAGDNATVEQIRQESLRHAMSLHHEETEKTKENPTALLEKQGENL